MGLTHNARVFKLETDITLALCENTDSARSLTVALLVRYGEWLQLMDLECNPEHYDCPRLFAEDYQVTEMLKKNPRVPLSVNRADVALGKFRAAEELCKQTNARLSNYQTGGISPSADVHRAVHHGREIIYGILGDLTPEDLHYAEAHMRFGPGATTSLRGVVTQGRKFSDRTVDGTPRVANFRLHGCFPAAWRETCTGINLRESSKVATVPKNAKTDRVICIEPDLNVYLQLGVGAAIRRRLLRSGLDLNTQEINRFLASMGAEWDLCTMDLSAASDTISREVVWLLLPDRWCHLLHYSRVDKTQMPDGEIIELEKWSSMGNGYTFELESCIFYGVIRGVLRSLGLAENLAVAYGDDLIFPSQAMDLVTRTLNFLGFKVNSEKTFGKGSFRESCGTDWFGSKDVRPFFLRSASNDFNTVCYTYANGLRRISQRFTGAVSCDVRYLPAWLRCFTAVAPGFRHRVPEGFGDVGFYSSFDQACPDTAGNGWQGFKFDFRRVVSVQTDLYPHGCYINRLRAGGGDFEGPLEDLRGRVSRYVTSRGYVLTWPHLGPWT